MDNARDRFFARVAEVLASAALPVYDSDTARSFATANNGCLVQDLRDLGLPVERGIGYITIVEVFALGGTVYFGCFRDSNTGRLYSDVTPGNVLMPIAAGLSKPFAVNTERPYLHVGADAATGTTARVCVASLPIGIIE